MKGTLNVLGNPLESCCLEPVTGFYRDGFCRTNKEDTGTHIICAVMTQEFLDYTKSKGNDLSTPAPYWNFPGLKPGDKWCLCISRWLQALKAGKAPKIILESCNQKALEFVQFETLLANKYTP